MSLGKVPLRLNRWPLVVACVCPWVVGACGRVGVDPIEVVVPDAAFDAAAVDTLVLDSERADESGTQDAVTASDAAADGLSYADRGCVGVGGLVTCDVQSQPRTFTQAQTFCAGLGLRLASIRSAEQNGRVVAWAQALNIREVMLGGSDQATEGTWRWPDGSAFWLGGSSGDPLSQAFTTWAAQEPNNANMNEDCLTIFVPTGLWNDVPCPLAFRALACE